MYEHATPFLVIQVEVNGLVCAGKKIHEILLDVGNIGVRHIAAKYVQECQLMSDLRHPNITLFLGLCFLPNCQLPVLVMETVAGLRGGLRGHWPTLLLDLCWSHANICTYMYARISNSILWSVFILNS